MFPSNMVEWRVWESIVDNGRWNKGDIVQKIIDYKLSDALKSFTIRGLTSKGKLVNKENLGVGIWTTKTSCCGLNVSDCTLHREAYVEAFRQQPTWATINASRNHRSSQPLTNHHRSHGACVKDANS